jgi:hypothetical protein
MEQTVVLFTKMRKSGVEKGIFISITPVLLLKAKHEMGVG